MPSRAAARKLDPDGWRKLCWIAGDMPVRVEEKRPYAVSVFVGPLELRFQVCDHIGWEWDEIVGTCFVHVEQMSDVSYWAGFSWDATGEYPEGRVCVDIGSASGRAAVRMSGWVE